MQTQQKSDASFASWYICSVTCLNTIQARSKNEQKKEEEVETLEKKLEEKNKEVFLS